CRGPSGTLATWRSRRACARPARPARRASQAAARIAATTSSRPIATRSRAESVIVSTPVVQAVDALGRGDDVGEADAVFLFDHHHLALGDEVAVDEDVHGLARQPVELDHRALAQLQQVLDGEPGAAQLDR